MKQSYTLDEYNSARSVVGDTITELGGKDERVWLLTPDIGFGCKDFQTKYPTVLSTPVLRSRMSLAFLQDWRTTAISRLSSA